jgi:hypothetical protein
VRDETGVLIGSSLGLVVMAAVVVVLGGSVVIAIALAAFAALIPLFFAAGSR